MFFLWFNGFLVICKNNFFLPTSSSFQDTFAEKMAIEEEACIKMETKTMLLQLLLCNMEVSVYKSALTLCLYHLDLLLILKAL